MELSLTLIDERTKAGRSYVAATPETEEFDRVKLVNLTGSSAVIAATLRAIADDLAPTKVSTPFAPGGIVGSGGFR